ncbi:MAG: hypothetical protein SNG27_07550 [Rikenellaceae bacterium]
MKRYNILSVALLLFASGCVSDPNLTQSSEQSCSIIGEWYYQGESVNDVEFRSYQIKEALIIGESNISSGENTLSYTFDTQTNTLLLEDGSQYVIEELTQSQLTLKTETNTIILKR